MQTVGDLGDRCVAVVLVICSGVVIRATGPAMLYDSMRGRKFNGAEW